MTGLFDTWQRQINYLRISVTDHCNLRCVYCSVGSIPHLAHYDILRYEEIQRVVQIASRMGISKIRLTGGEPLLRPGLSTLVNMIARIEGIDDISLTSNGILLGRYASELKEAGLKRVNISLDTLKPERFKLISGGGKLSDVLDGIEAAHRAGLEPVKLNMVVMRGINDDEAIDLARMSIIEGWHVRFIELMPFGIPGTETLEMVSTREIQEAIQSLGKLEPHTGLIGNGPARYYRFSGARGTIGFITPMTEHFCHSCNRLRITSDGQLRPCLLADDEVNLKEALRNGAGTDELKGLIQQAVNLKRKQHNFTGKLIPEIAGRPMCQIGG
jgi:cyclic pyranopterin phosphate synthase